MFSLCKHWRHNSLIFYVVVVVCDFPRCWSLILVRKQSYGSKYFIAILSILYICKHDDVCVTVAALFFCVDRYCLLHLKI